MGPSGESDTPIMSFQLQQNAVVPLLARCIVLNFGHNAAKQLFAKQDGRRHDVIKTLCVTKACVTWFGEETFRICRERCGGQSYLCANLGHAVLGAHSGMTAEGDNRVLMQKVVKDILVHTRNGKHKVPKVKRALVREMAQADDVCNFVCLKNLIYLKEQVETKEMMTLLQDLVVNQKRTFFEAWTTLVNDEIQSLAQSFGERFFLHSAVTVLNDDCSHAGARGILEKVISLHMLAVLEKDLDWYLLRNLITAKAARGVVEAKVKAVKDLMPHLNDCVESLGVHQIDSNLPVMMRDFVGFNAQRDFENFDAAGKAFDFAAGATPQSQYRPRL